MKNKVSHAQLELKKKTTKKKLLFLFYVAIKVPYLQQEIRSIVDTQHEAPHASHVVGVGKANEAHCC